MGDLGSYTRAAQARKALLDRGARNWLGDEEDNACAWHEGGHCLVGLLLGFSPRSATIEASDDYDGKTVFFNPRGDGSAFARCVLSVSGSEAERLFGAADDLSETDLVQARAHAMTISDDDEDDVDDIVDDIVERARGVARRILKANFGALMSIAIELINERTLDLGEIEEAITANSAIDDDAELLLVEAEAERLLASISASHRDNEDDDDGDDDDDGMMTVAELLSGKGMRLVRYDGGGVV